MKTTIIINEQHTLLPEQVEILTTRFKKWDTLLVPANGWTKLERDRICAELRGNVVFVSPIPGMILGLTANCQAACSIGSTPRSTPYVFSNDNREKKELPGGRVVSIVAQTGWYLE